MYTQPGEFWNARTNTHSLEFVSFQAGIRRTGYPEHWRQIAERLHAVTATFGKRPYFYKGIIPRSAGG
jgi:hypothetical protein